MENLQSCGAGILNIIVAHRGGGWDICKMKIKIARLSLSLFKTYLEYVYLSISGMCPYKDAQTTTRKKLKEFYGISHGKLCACNFRTLLGIFLTFIT